MNNFKKQLSESLKKVQSKLVEGKEVYQDRIGKERDPAKKAKDFAEADKVARRIMNGGDYKTASLDWVGPDVEGNIKQRRLDILDLGIEIALEEYANTDNQALKDNITKGIFTAYGPHNKSLVNVLKKHREIRKILNKVSKEKAQEILSQLGDSVYDVFNDFTFEGLIDKYLKEGLGYDSFGKWFFVKLPNYYLMRGRKKDAMSRADSMDKGWDADDEMTAGDKLASSVGAYDETMPDQEVSSENSIEAMKEVFLDYIENIRDSGKSTSEYYSRLAMLAFVSREDNESIAEILNSTPEKIQIEINNMRAQTKLEWSDAVEENGYGSVNSPLYNPISSEKEGRPIYNVPIRDQFLAQHDELGNQLSTKYSSSESSDREKLKKQINDLIEKGGKASNVENLLDQAKEFNYRGKFLINKKGNIFFKKARKPRSKEDERLKYLMEKIKKITGTNLAVAELQNAFKKGSDKWGDEIDAIFNQFNEKDKVEIKKLEKHFSTKSKPAPKLAVPTTSIEPANYSEPEMDSGYADVDDLDAYYANLEESIGKLIMKKLLN